MTTQSEVSRKCSECKKLVEVTYFVNSKTLCEDCYRKVFPKYEGK